MSSVDPQNPYHSCMVEASAGSGKTYQLSKRFLMLVGSGAAPESILTMTFTVKAAQEMRVRIIEEATTLLVDSNAQADYTSRLAAFYEQKKDSLSLGYTLAPPKTAVAAAQEILSATQKLRILTIDSLFHEWVMRFLGLLTEQESSQSHQKKMVSTAQIQLLDSAAVDLLHDDAWSRLLHDDDSCALFLEAYQHIRSSRDPIPIMQLKPRIQEVYHHVSHLFYLEKKGQGGFQQYELSKDSNCSGGYPDLIERLAPSLEKVAAVTSKKDVLIEAISERSIDKLVVHRLLTKQLEVSKQTIRGKKREQLRDEINDIDETFARYGQYVKKKRLMVLGKALASIYKLWKSKRDLLKAEKGQYEFSDLVQLSYELFFNPDYSGVTWLIQQSIQHILIDEFQDTSFLQWQIFSQLSDELLSGYQTGEPSGLIPTVFIVGDKKQSIYGFREADPMVMDSAKQFLLGFEQSVVSLTHSYRTAPLILDFINHLFVTHIDPDFPVHETAMGADGQPVVPNVSQVTVADVFSASEDDQRSPLEKEAQYVASYLQHAMTVEKRLVFDKKKGGFRKLRPSDCCVLYRNSTHVAAFEYALRHVKLPYQRAEKGGFFERHEIQEMMSLLTFLINPSDLEALVAFLKSPMIGVLDHEVIEVLAQTVETEPSERSYHVLSTLQASYPKISLVFDLAQRALVVAPHVLLLDIYHRLSLVSCYEQSLTSTLEKDLVNKNLEMLVEIFIEFESQGELSLYECMAALAKKKEQDALGHARVEMEAVHLMTIHKAKGLEFAFVCVVECAELWFRSDRYWTKQESGLYYVDTHPNMPHEDPEFSRMMAAATRSQQEESIRLLYVALTRASHYLLMTGHETVRRVPGHCHQFMTQTIQQRGESSQDQKDASTWQANDRGGYGVIMTEQEVSRQAPTFEGVSVPSVMQKELEIINPHDQLQVKAQTTSDMAEQVVRLNPAGLSLMGTFVHYALERYVIDKQVDIKQLWSYMVLGHPDMVSQGLSVAKWQSLYEAIEQEILETIAAASFCALFVESQMVSTEVPVAYMRGHHLIRGVIDLLVQYHDATLFIMDYKTTVFSQTESLKASCLAQGYQRQLTYYAQVLQALYPKHTIKKGVWLTKYRQLVML